MPDEKRNTTPPTVITLTLPEQDSEGTLLIQRGDLAHMSQFPYTTEIDFTAVIQQAISALAIVESDPPVIPDPPRRTSTPKAVPSSDPPEPVFQVPTRKKKGRKTTAIPTRCLHITGGEAAHDAALKVAGRLLDSGLWDGKTPIGINDVYATQLSLDGLTDKELKVLFTLEQFVQTGEMEQADPDLHCPKSVTT